MLRCCILQRAPRLISIELLASFAGGLEDNLACRLMGYTDYHKKRDTFFSEAIPAAAAKAGYKPEVKANFK